MNLDELLGMTPGASGPADDGDAALLERNLTALAQRSPREAELIRQAAPKAGVEFVETDEGLSATLAGVALASKRRPLSEANKLAQTIENEEVALIGVEGFALGHHCTRLLSHLGNLGVVVCYEPDAALMRRVLSRIDHTELFSSGRFFLISDPGDAVRCNEILTGNEALVGMGVRLLAHPPSKARLGETGDRFGQTLTTALRAARTHVVTTLANARVSFRNAVMNLDHYVRTEGIAQLHNACAGKAAIVVSAGPSLEKNLELLRDPVVRERFVIVAVQTVLKPMLAMGIRPHFVAALDYHEVSGRFYEGLSAADVEGVRLIAEPKANPVILDAFPGEVICPREEVLDRLLGESLYTDRGELPAGATVAHLCYSFARYLGCDPVILIGQDLGFSDGQYYANGAAIHDVWGSELGAHRSLEMLEWERVVRMRANLQRREDVFGKAIYSDEQMCSYLAQFEQMFKHDTARGLRVVDASEGGVRKQGAEVMTLREAIDLFGNTPIRLTDGIGRKSDAPIGQEVFDRLDALISNCETIERLSVESISTLGDMLEHQHDQRRVGSLIERVNKAKEQVMARRDAFSIIESVNQVAVLRRMKRDRVIKLRSKDAEPMERQRLQIERDISNVEWTRDAARSVGEQITQLKDILSGRAEKVTSDQPETEHESSSGIETRKRDRVHAMVIVDPEFGGLGTKRTLGARLLPESVGGHNTLQTTLARLNRCAQVDAITIVTPDALGVRELLGSMPLTHTLDIVEIDAGVLRSHASRVGAARMRSSSSWRGTLGYTSVFDEVAHPALLAHVMEQRSIDAAAVVGADWAMVDPKLVDRTVERLRQQQSEKRIAFSQACVGLGTMVVDRATMRSLSDALITNGRRNHFASLGALISYIPTAPQSDPIVRAVCEQISPELRDAGLRAIADSHERIGSMSRAFAALSDPISADGIECLQSLREQTKVQGPSTLVLETCSGRLIGGDWGIWRRRSRESVERAPLGIPDAHRMMRDLSGLREDCCVLFDGVGDPLMHPGAMDLVTLAKEDGVACVEMRTDLVREGIGLEEILDSGLDVLSVDVIADSREMYQHLAGIDAYDTVCDRLQLIYDATGTHPMWLSANLTRCEQTLDQIESFYDKWLMLTGCAIIDPAPEMAIGQRIRPLRVPEWRQSQLAREIMRVRCDGVVVDEHGKALTAQGTVINAIEEGVERAYQRSRSSLRAGELEIKLGAKEPAA
jgi:hypothetical protein